MKKVWIILGVAMILVLAVASSNMDGDSSRSSTGTIEFVTETNTTQYPANKYSTAVYFGQIINIYEEVTNSFESLKQLESYRQYWTNKDVAEVAKYTVIIEKSYEKISAITPPEDLTSIHQEVLGAFELIRDSMPVYRTAIDKNDAQLYNRFMNMLSTANDTLSRITDKFK